MSGSSHRQQDSVLPLFSTPVYRSGERWNFSKEELEFLDKVENKFSTGMEKLESAYDWE